MKKLLTAISIAIVVSLILLTLANQDPVEQSIPTSELNRPLMGTAGFVPPNYPNFDNQDLVGYWAKVDQSGELYGVHTDWQDLGLIDVALENTQLDLVVVLGFQTPKEWQDSSAELRKTIAEILNKSTRIKYLAVGNEINEIYRNHTGEFEFFVDAISETREMMNSDFPDVQLFTTFNYEFMAGKAPAAGRDEDDVFAALEMVESKIDIVGLTTYPYFLYSTPKEIPLNYYSSIRRYSDKPLAFTEIGWPSRQELSEEYAPLNEAGYMGSETEQVDFLDRFIQITNKEKVEFFNWAFLNDVSQWSEGEINTNIHVSHTLFDSIGLNQNNGESKEVWNLWELTLKNN